MLYSRALSAVLVRLTVAWLVVPVVREHDVCMCLTASATGLSLSLPEDAVACCSFALVAASFACRRIISSSSNSALDAYRRRASADLSTAHPHSPPPAAIAIHPNGEWHCSRSQYLWPCCWRTRPISQLYSLWISGVAHLLAGRSPHSRWQAEATFGGGRTVASSAGCLSGWQLRNMTV